MHTSTLNAFTVDVEDWYHVCDPEREPAVTPAEWRVERNIALILELLAEAGVRATFFVLGSIAEAIPGLVPQIAGQGHEIASHGYSHRLVSQLAPEEFREELRRAGDILTSQCGYKPKGFRAPRWSLSAATPWAFQILAEEGYTYDSSCAPLAFIGERTGSRIPFRKTVEGRQLWEIPPLVTPTPFGNLPTGGGWGFRFFPLSLIGSTMESLNRAGAPGVLFFHPREVDPFGPRLELPPLQAFATYGLRTDATPRLKELFRRFRFAPLRELVESWNTA